MQYIDHLYSSPDIAWSVGTNPAISKALWTVLSDLRQVGYRIGSFRHVFGSPQCRLSAGRVLEDTSSIEDFRQTILTYMSFDVGVRLTMQKYEVTQDDLGDPVSKALLERLDFYGRLLDNGVICSSDDLMHHVRDHYPNLKVISSLVKPAIEVGLAKDTPEYYNRLLADYDIVVVGASRVFEPGFIESLADPSRIEVIVNSNCTRNCKLAKEHYLQIERANEANVRFGIGSPESKAACEKLSALHQSCVQVKAKGLGRNMLSMSTEQVDALVRKGVRNFKLEGREYAPSAVVNDLSYYMTERHLFYRYMKRSRI